MSIKTAIQWCDSTVNPTVGCDGCELWNNKHKSCYAGRITTQYAGTGGYPDSFDRIERRPGRMADAARWSDLLGRPRPDNPCLDDQPRLIFVSDMADALSKGISFEYLEAQIIAHVDSAPGRRHLWLWLTKRPGRMAEFSRWLRGDLGLDWPSNLWAGTSVTSQATVSRIDALLEVGDEHTGRFLSVEPQWEAIDLGQRLGRVDWVIQGGASSDKAHPFDLAWARRLRDDCALGDVPYFLKQLGSYPVLDGQPIKLDDGHGGDPDQWPADLRHRQTPRFARWLPAPAANRDEQTGHAVALAVLG